MVTKYEIKHFGGAKSFDRLEDACKHGVLLEKLGYAVTLSMVTYGLYSKINIIIYQTSK